MALHVNLTMMILFTNIMLALAVPDLGTGENQFFEQDSNGEYVIKGTFSESLQNSNPDPKTGEEDPGFLDTGAQIFSGLFLIFDFVGLLFKVLFSTPLILNLVHPVLGLIVGIPMFVGYGFAIMGFIRG